jgi:hypothetical protein
MSTDIGGWHERSIGVSLREHQQSKAFIKVTGLKKPGSGFLHSEIVPIDSGATLFKLMTELHDKGKS